MTQQVKATATSKGGIGFVGGLTLLFIALKLIGIIQWSWLWVLSPIWISTVGVILIVVLVTILAVAATDTTPKKKKKV